LLPKFYLLSAAIIFNDGKLMLAHPQSG